jgi:hypothetical protein
MTTTTAAPSYTGGPLDGRPAVSGNAPYRTPDGDAESTTAGDDRLLRGRWQPGDSGLYVLTRNAYRWVAARC